MPVHYITWSPDENGEKERFRAPYATLAEAKEQARHDVDVNGRVDVKIEDAQGKTVWEP